MSSLLTTAILIAGTAQFGVLIASALVPSRLNWQAELKSLPRLHRQMHWIYGGYVVLAIVAFGLISLLNASELAGGSALARSVCAYIAVFWGVRFALQWVMDTRDYINTWWLSLGNCVLTLLFIAFALIYGYAALRP